MKFPITFLFPPDFLAQKLPSSTNDDWSKYRLSSSHGCIYATYLALKESHVPCNLDCVLPHEGIVIAHPLTLALLKPVISRRIFVVCWQHDYPRCDWAQLHIVMNTYMASRAGLKIYDALLWPGPRFVLHFIPEPSLIPRAAERGATFENIAFMGEPKNLLPEIQSPEVQRQIKELGCRLSIHGAVNTQANYSDVDAVLAIRPAFHETKQKSPHKLWNAWRAGVPAILGPEPGFRDYRQSDLDYIEARDASEALAAIKKLKHDHVLREAMVQNGHRRTKECSLTELVTQWKSFFAGPLTDYSSAWFSAPPWHHKMFSATRSMRTSLRTLRKIMKRA